MKALAVLLWAAFVALVVTIGAVLLPACGLLTFLSTVVPGAGWNFCAASPADLLSAANDALGRRAQELELAVARQTLSCLTMSKPSRPSSSQAAIIAPSSSTPQAQTTPPSATSPAAAEPKTPSPTNRPAETPAGDYTFLKGCWQSDPFRHTSSEPIGQSTYCFDESGAGQLEYRRFDRPDYSCRMAVQAAPQGEQLRLQDSDGRCSDGTPWYADNLECGRSTGDVTECHGTSATPNGKESFPLRLHRVR